MNILKKPLLIGLIIISFSVFVFINYSSNKNNKIFTKFINDTSLETVSFLNKDQKKFFLSDFKGKVLLVNLWATWCLPCKIEMPSLDRLQKNLGDNNFEVIAIAVEKTDISKIIDFYKETNIDHLKIYQDKTTKSGLYTKATGLPLTLLIAKNGEEIGRRNGPWEWDSDEVMSIIQELKTAN